MNILHSEDVKDEDGKITNTFLNGMHLKNVADVAAVDKVSVTAATADLSSYWGQQIAFKDIVKAGALVKKSDGNYGQAGGFTMGWDNCSDTPYLYNKDKTTVVTYDGALSFVHMLRFLILTSVLFQTLGLLLTKPSLPSQAAWPGAALGLLTR